MKIKNVELKIVNSAKTNDAFVLDRAVSLKVDIYTNEKNIRRACFLALKSTAKLKKKNMRFFVSKEVASIFQATSIARIMAQEFYRFIKEENKSIEKIDIVVSDEKLYVVISKIINGYLKHLLEVLVQGPLMTVDAIIETKAGIILIKRTNPPLGWALPGGFVDYGESLEEAVVREAKEETGLALKNIKQMHTYSKPGRDPRFQTVTTVFVGQASGKPKAGSDAQDIVVVKPNEWKNLHLAFDHAKVLQDYLCLKKSG